MSRIRSQNLKRHSQTDLNKSTGKSSLRFENLWNADTLQDSKSRPCQLRRVRYDTVDALILEDSISLVSQTSYAGSFFNRDISFRDYVHPYLNRLNVKKLATSNQADILTNLAEFDDTVLMFGKNLKKSASYGGYKWGWSPLINDIMAVNDAAAAVKNSVLDGNRRTNRYVTIDKFVVSSPILDTSYCKVRHHWDVSVKYSGTISYENDILAFYDYMGFHPSPKLIWDLVPLSFAVDYVLPIGDMLSNISPARGWVKSANFTGWRVVKATLREEIVELKSPYKFLLEHPPSHYVFRDYLNGVHLEQKRIRKELRFNFPTIQQAFDLAYLSSAFYNTGRKAISPHVYRKKIR